MKNSRRRSNAFGLAALVVMFACPSPAPAIVGRTHAADQAQSLVMVLGRDSRSAGFCSGVVIAPRAVLTAAHCVHAPADTRIHFKDASGAPILLDVARVVRHPGYRADAIAARARTVDLALVFARDDLAERFRPASVASASDAIGTSFTLAGYGILQEGAPNSGGVLRATDVALRAPPSNLLLWLAGDGGACTGDSGGGVFDRDGALVGIIAFAQGVGSSRCGALTQAVRVAPFRSWIKEAIGR